MEGKNRRSGEENGYDRKKTKEIERATIDRSKNEDKERVTRITDLVTGRIGRTETGKKQQEEEVKKKETKKEIKKLKRLMEDREKRERINY